MSYLSFQASTGASSKKDIGELVNDDHDYPFQIMPGGRKVVSSADIEKFPTGKNPNVLIHSTYICRPFGDESKSDLARHCLKGYAQIARRLGSRNVLVHMPYSPAELERFGPGIELIRESLEPYECELHLETEPLTISLRKQLDLSEGNAYSVYTSYVEKLFEVAPDAKLVVDTAHLFANGLDTDDQIRFIEKFKSKITFIHLNGNMNGKFRPDKHVPMFDARNKLCAADKLSSYIAKLRKMCIVENSTEGATRPKWDEYADRFGFSIVSNFECFSY